MSCKNKATAFISLINFTPYAWKELGASGTANLALLSPPSEVSAYQITQLEAHFCSNNNGKPATLSYQIGQDAGSTITISLAVPNNQPLLSVRLDGIRTLNNAQGQSISLGWKNPLVGEDDAWIPLILAGDEKNFVGNNPPANWMQQSLPFLGCRTLYDLALPGTHDSGTSYIHDGTFGADEDNTRAQELDILGQLNAGVRYFDIRPVLEFNQFWTGHYDTPRGTNAGASGQSITSIIQNLNDFTASSGELVILSLKNFLNKDASPWAAGFTDDHMTALLKQMLAVKTLFRPVPAVDLRTATLQKFIGNGAAVVVLISNPGTDQAFLDKHGFSGQGFYLSESLPVHGKWAQTDDVIAMQRAIYLDFHDTTAWDDSNLYNVAWTTTLNWVEDAGFSDKSIQKQAAKANARLAEVADLTSQLDAPNDTFLRWRGPKGRIVNIVSVDYVKSDRQLAAMCLALNRLHAQSACMQPSSTTTVANLTTSTMRQTNTASSQPHTSSPRTQSAIATSASPSNSSSPYIESKWSSWAYWGTESLSWASSVGQSQSSPWSSKTARLSTASSSSTPPTSPLWSTTTPPSPDRQSYQWSASSTWTTSRVTSSPASDYQEWNPEIESSYSKNWSNTTFSSKITSTTSPWSDVPSTTAVQNTQQRTQTIASKPFHYDKSRAKLICERIYGMDGC